MPARYVRASHTADGGGEAMTNVTLDDIDVLDVGSAIQLDGAIYSGNGKLYIVPLPDAYLDGEWTVLQMDTSQWERFLNQSDVLDVRGPGKAILRKSQRQIDQWIAWEVFERDGYRCRYCGKKAPLTVDHVILWEQGGATVTENLISSCRRCNKLRGSMEYGDWIESKEYSKVSVDLPVRIIEINLMVLNHLDELRAIKQKGRSR
jgi:HNH endonuclease